MKRSGHSGSIDPNYKARGVVKADKPNPKIPPPPKEAPEFADPKDVLRALARAKRILLISKLLTMPCRPTVH